MANAHVRKTFHYPSSDESDNDERYELDEEEQERLIKQFIADDAERDRLYRNAFLMIPVFGSLFFIYLGVHASNARQTLVSVLSISCLVASAYVLKFMPVKSPGKGKTPLYKIEADKGPVERYLIFLNLVMAVLLSLFGVVDLFRGFVDRAMIEALPPIMTGIMLFVRQQLAPLDLEELQQARYEYKGA